MARKTKSLDQINAQRDKLTTLAENNYNFARIDRIYDIAQRYRDNINAYGNRIANITGRDQRTGAGYGTLKNGKGDWNGRQAQIPRSVYMGTKAKAVGGQG